MANRCAERVNRNGRNNSKGRKGPQQREPRLPPLELRSAAAAAATCRDWGGYGRHARGGGRMTGAILPRLDSVCLRYLSSAWSCDWRPGRTLLASAPLRIRLIAW